MARRLRATRIADLSVARKDDDDIAEHPARVAGLPTAGIADHAGRVGAGSGQALIEKCLRFAVGDIHVVAAAVDLLAE